MPVTSKYSDKQVEAILNDMINVLENHRAPADLSLMIVGDLATNIINNNVPDGQREAIADKFAAALRSSVKDKK
ncbi:YejL family protein [Thaumasiovibrio subtropicus]|uniref:YejL family protein n=1 Tax=Thaumasiovibrio subtropicus TaxID=1891207 RepID=UPI000B34F259|nr:YejL family protein [Thaumasiovibrio subtropicus]